MPNLKQLALGIPIDERAVEILAPTLSRLQSVCVCFEANEVQFALLRHLGPLCTHLWLRTRLRGQLVLTDWPSINRQLLAQLTHLNLQGGLKDGIEGLNLVLECTTSLHVLHCWFQQNVSF